jgi:3-methyl-2-oxobutanoate hydroxymethyltransferase
METKKLKYPQDWIWRKQNGPPLSVITVYDATMAKLANMASVDALLVGDSLGMVVQGNTSTIPVTFDEMIYHCKLSRRGAPDSFIIGDLPFGSYQESEEKGLHNAFRMMKEAGMSAVKAEGSDVSTLRLIEKIVRSGVPVMGHIGLLPQSYLNLGGYRVQGRKEIESIKLIQAAKDLESAGVFSMVLEYIVINVAREITESISIPTIGIGSGNHTSGQVLVWHDALGLNPDFKAKHSKRFADLDKTIINSLNKYDEEVKNKIFPSDENSFT